METRRFYRVLGGESLLLSHPARLQVPFTLDLKDSQVQVLLSTTNATSLPLLHLLIRQRLPLLSLSNSSLCSQHGRIRWHLLGEKAWVAPSGRGWRLTCSPGLSGTHSGAVSFPSAPYFPPTQRNCSPCPRMLPFSSASSCRPFSLPRTYPSYLSFQDLPPHKLFFILNVFTHVPLSQVSVLLLSSSWTSLMYSWSCHENVLPSNCRSLPVFITSASRRHTGSLACTMISRNTCRRHERFLLPVLFA